MANLTPDGLTSDEALAAVGRTLAAIEADCSKSWPKCPRQSLLCDCRLRAVRACNALAMTFGQPTTSDRLATPVSDPPQGQ